MKIMALLGLVVMTAVLVIGIYYIMQLYLGKDTDDYE